MDKPLMKKNEPWIKFRVTVGGVSIIMIQA